MADGSPPDIDEPTWGGIVKDPIDIRDRSYEPTLASLSASLLPHARIVDALRKGGPTWLLPRSQGAEGTCGGQALAALIDLERIRAGVGKAYSVSARMLYQCARLKNECTEGDDVSLRDVIKAFYNYGACREDLWPYTANPDDPGALTYTSAGDAKNLSLGAYYRLRPNLNTYHAALHEAGALLVSAELHDGWSRASLRRNKGIIVPPEFGAESTLTDCHAFLIVGYTPQGFLVLNSWGRDWGGWPAPARRKRGEPKPPEQAIPGVALWTYADWADRIIDGWVLRLGVGAAEAFDYSIGDMGLGYGVDTAVRSTPVHTILGNFLHLDDGEFVSSGAYVSTLRTLAETESLLTAPPGELKREPAKGVLLTFAGGLQGLKEAADHVARWKRLVRERDWHPFTVLWCVDYIEQARAVLEGVFREAETRTGGPGKLLDRVVEDRAHGIGRALWRDIGCAAVRSARAGGPLHQLAGAGVRIADARAADGRPGFGLRIVAESEGAFALSALLAAMGTGPFADIARPFFAMLESVDVVAPPLTAAEYAALAMYLNAGWGQDHPERRIRLHVPTAADERRLTVPPYGRSYFELVHRSFQRRCEDAALAPKKAGDPSAPDPECEALEPAPGSTTGIARKWGAFAEAPRTVLVPIEWTKKGQPPPIGPINQLQLLYRSDVAGRLRAVTASETVAVPDLVFS